jgi:hypothetical protein
MPRIPRLLSAFLLLAALSTPVVFAKEAHARAQAKPRTTATLGTSATARLSELWGALTHLWGMNGCSIDPYGSCGGNATAPKPPLPTLDNGCGIDPYGSCTH